MSLHVHVTTAPQWISSSQRKPTEADSDERGFVWYDLGGPGPVLGRYDLKFEGLKAVFFHPIPKRIVPSLPKPKEKTQKEKDTEKFDEIQERDTEYPEDAHDFANWARAEERKRFAQECLSTCNIVGAAQILLEKDYEVMPANLLALHKLLTEAAK